MSAPTMVTEREAVLRERNAFDAGTRWQHKRLVRLQEGNPTLRNSWSLYPVEAEVKSAYPLPKVTQPRQIKDPLEWRIMWSVCEDVIVGEALDSGHWYPLTAGHSAFTPVATRVAVWADLLANPTEEVEADA